MLSEMIVFALIFVWLLDCFIAIKNEHKEIQCRSKPEFVWTVYFTFAEFIIHDEHVTQF